LRSGNKENLRFQIFKLTLSNSGIQKITEHGDTTTKLTYTKVPRKFYEQRFGAHKLTSAVRITGD